MGDIGIRMTADQSMNFSDLKFARREVVCYSSCGTPFTRTMSLGMPRIPPKVLNGVVYLYKTRADAEASSEKGGTGFFVALPSVVPGTGYVYIVTNWHVAVDKGFSVVRVDRVDGKPDIFEFDPSDWFYTSEYDIAVIVAPIEITGETHNIAFIDISSFLTKELKEREKVGPGDDAFMVGRFVDHQGSNQNVPAVRFGHISMDPAPVVQPNGVAADTYCLDVHSRSGYSGSPVFVYRTPGYDLEERLGSGLEAKFLFSGTNLLRFLGIHWGQFPEIWEVTDRGKVINESIGENHEHLITDGRFIKGVSGMTCVLPAWTIAEVLDMPELKKGRDARNAKLTETSGDIPIAEGA